MYSVKKLIDSLCKKKTKDDLEILKCFAQYSENKSIAMQAANSIDEFLLVDLSVIDSLINPNKFKFEKQNLEKNVVKND